MSDKKIIFGSQELLRSPVGNKVSNIIALLDSGVRVPRGFGIAYAVYEQHIQQLLPQLEVIRVQSKNYVDMSMRMQDLIISKTLDDADVVMSAIDLHISDSKFFAVRSSGAPLIKGQEVFEDSSGVSLAGQYESFLQVPREFVPKAILSCYASLFNERCLKQYNVLEDGSYIWSRMSVLVQEMCSSDLCAIIMTRDPIEGGDNFGIEISYGACEALVSGDVQGDLYLLSRKSGVLLSSETGTKKSSIEHKPFKDMYIDNKIRSTTSVEMQEKFSASHKLISKIYQLGMFIENSFGSPQDIELIVSDEEIIVTQTRPITTNQ